MVIDEDDKPVRTEPFGYEWPGAHFIGAEELEFVKRVVECRSPFRFRGLDCLFMCEAFEKEFASRLGRVHALAVCSGTAALNVALAALRVGPGQEVIVPGYMWISTISAVVHRGAIPVLAEIDESFCLDPTDVERKITPKTKVIIHVHMNGSTGNIARVRDLAKARGLYLVEDCAQSLGATHHGKPLGTFGDIAAFSFQYAKAMTTGDGGMVVTDDPDLHRTCLALQDIGHSRQLDGRTDVPDVEVWGLGVRMTELQAAMGRVQLRKLRAIVRAMRSAKDALKSALCEIDGIGFRRLEDEDGDNGSFLLTTFDDVDAARGMALRLTELGLVSGPRGRLVYHLPDWAFHVYSGVPQLVKKLSNSPDGFPWTHPLNLDSDYAYGHGTLPRLDDLVSRTVLQAIPSNATREDVDDMIRIYRRAAREVLTSRGG